MKEKLKAKAIRRLRVIGGQVQGLENMVAKDKYCVDIINQSLAAKQALSSFEDLILENHLDSHVVEQMKNGQEAKAIKEILKVYRLSKKK